MKVTDVIFNKMPVGAMNPSGMLGIATVVFDGNHPIDNFKVYYKSEHLVIKPPVKADVRGKTYPVVTLDKEANGVIQEKLLSIIKNF